MCLLRRLFRWVIWAIVQASSLNKAAYPWLYISTSLFIFARAFKASPRRFSVSRAPGTAYICVVVRHKISLPAIYISRVETERILLGTLSLRPIFRVYIQRAIIKISRDGLLVGGTKSVFVYFARFHSVARLSRALDSLDPSFDLSSAVAAHLTWFEHNEAIRPPRFFI